MGITAGLPFKPISRRTGVTTPALVAVLFFIALAAAPAARGDVVVCLTAGDDLVRVDSSTPGTIVNTVQITGTAGNDIVAIDFRPATGEIYALGRTGGTGRIFRGNPLSGGFAQVGAPFALSGTEFGFDFNPMNDRIRIVSNDDTNLQVHPDNGVVTSQTPLNPGNPNIVGSAYTNNFAGAGTTTLFGIDSGNDSLFTQNPPASGTLTLVGGLGVDTSGFVGLDVDTLSGRALATLTVGGNPGLYTINLTTGAATLIGDIGGTEQIDGVAALPGNPPLVGLTGNNVLQTFSAAQPGSVGSVPVTGLQAAENVVGIDFRPATGALYGVGSTSRLYTINPMTGAATQVGAGTFAVPLDGASFGVDFNPVPDRIRIVSDTELNMRVNPNDGTVVDGDPGTGGVQPDTPLNPAGNVVGSAYTNAFNGALNTTLFGIDSGSDMLVRQGGVNGTPSPNGGQLFNIGPLGVDFGPTAGFDIDPNGNDPLAALTTVANTGLHVLSSSGAATLVGSIGNGDTPLIGLTRRPAGNVAFDMASYSVREDQAAAIINLNRSAGSNGPVGVEVFTQDGTAQGGVDFDPNPRNVRIGDGNTGASVAIAVDNDGAAEGDQTFNVGIRNVTGGAGLGPSTATVTIKDPPGDAATSTGASPSGDATQTLPVVTGGGVLPVVPTKASFKIADNESPIPLNSAGFSFGFQSTTSGLHSLGGVVDLSAFFFPPRGAASRRFRLKTVRKNIVANRRTRIRMRLPRTAYRAMRRAFRRGRKRPFRVRITASVAGQTGRGTVRLGPPSRRRR